MPIGAIIKTNYRKTAMRLKTFTALLLSTFFIMNLYAQLPKREFRAVWVATVENIDWPSRRDLTSGEQQNEIIQILDHHKKNNINAIILQVRPAADAIYKSAYEPWSRYLSGIQGKAPEPYYDPLTFWITEAHKRGMELHAWFNPYRIKQNLLDSLASDHIINEYPGWGWEYGNRLYFAPDNPMVWDFVTRVVTDVVRNYDVDAIHFDDYFYPYRVAGQEIPDEEAFMKYGADYYPNNKEEWRRHNVDTIIQILSAAIKAEKPWVKFGISPFGVWRNRTEDPYGSETRAGTSNYDGLYADVIKWQREGWIDYLMPQLYWRDDHPAADFSTLAYWWRDHNYGRAMYYGLAPYRISRESEHKQWRKKRFFYRKIDIIRSMKGVDGFGFFSSKHFFREDLQSFDHKLERKYMGNPSLVPEMTWIDDTPPPAPENLRRELNRLEWDSIAVNDPMNKSRFYVIYYSKEEDMKLLRKGENIIAVTGENHFDFAKDIPEGVYRVSALDRLNNESPLSKPLIIESTGFWNRIF
jgi:uncharacterized lipoprotein YddW (UPF0748 family)